MSLAIPKKKRIIKLILIIGSLVDALLDNDESDTVQEQCGRLIGIAECKLNDFPANEGEWSEDQTALWDLVDSIAAAHDPEAVAQPTTLNYEHWVADLETAIAVVSE